MLLAWVIAWLREIFWPRQHTPSAAAPDPPREPAAEYLWECPRCQELRLLDFAREDVGKPMPGGVFRGPSYCGICGWCLTPVVGVAAQ